MKVCLLGKEGVVKEIIVFSRGNQPESPFNEKEQNFIDQQNIPVRVVDSEIYIDDSISVIKHKILKILENPMAYHEIYLFSHIHKEDLHKVLLGSKTVLTPPEYKQLLVNLGATSEILSSISTEKMEYDTEDLAHLDEVLHNELYKISIGKRFRTSHNDLFSPNPFDILSSSVREPIWRQQSSNPLESFENQLLLNNYGAQFIDDTIFVCFAEDVIDYCSLNAIDTEWAMEIYFPLLARENITTADELERAKKSLITKTKKTAPTAKNDTIDILYDIHREQLVKPSFLNVGVSVFSMILHPNFKHILPLDVIFKNVHATKEIPFIKYNPGPRRENIYRLYSEAVTKYGTKIPFLPAKTIIKLAKETGKIRQISFSVESEAGDFYINILTNGEIHISGNNFKNILALDELERVLDQVVNPVIDHINDFLKKNGYELNRFSRFNQEFVEIEYMNYIHRMAIKKDIDLKAYKNCFQAVFDIVDTDIHKGADLRYKRVENYISMNGEDAYIAGLFHHPREEIITMISEKYEMPLQQAGLRLAQFLRDHEQQQGRFVKTSMKIADSPGFTVSMKIEPYENVLRCEFELDNSIADIYTQYIQVFSIYFSSLMLITQEPKTSGIPVSKISKICSKEKEEKEIERFDNVLTGIQPTSIIDTTFEDNLLYDIPEEIEEEPLKRNSSFGDLDEYENAEVIPDVLDYEELEPGELSSLEEPSKDETGDLSSLEESTKDEPGELSSLEEPSKDETGDLSSLEESTKEEPLEEMGKSSESSQSSSSSSPNLMYFGGGGDGKNKLDGMLLKEGNNNIFLGKLKKKEPTLFLSEDDGKFSAYSKICQASAQRQPILLTPEEKENIDKEDAKTGSKSYSHALEYGTDPENQNFYICPRYWCLKTNAPIDPRELKEVKDKDGNIELQHPTCGKVLPPGSKTVKPGHYIVEFNNAKQHRDKNGNYFENTPGFLDDSLHPKGHCMPCCFKKAWDSKSQQTRRDECKSGEKTKNPKKITSKQENYIIDIRRYPIPQHRWGFLPISVQYFLQTDNSLAVHPDNNKNLRDDKPIQTLLRYGVENSSKKSFIACIADIYAYKKDHEEVPTIEMMCQIISNAVSIDLFLSYHNGSLASIFRPKTYEQDDINPTKYEDAEFMKGLNQGDDSHLDYIYDTIASYESFISFMTNPDSYIDHTYLWDIVCSPNPYLFSNGLNLAILKIRNVDMTDDIELLCPTSVYSPVLFDIQKESVILIKHDEYFEPVYLFKSKPQEKPIIEKTFVEKKSLIHDILQIIRMSIETNCNPKPSILEGSPKVYKFAKALSAESLRIELLKHKFIIKGQIINYQSKVIGLWVKYEKRGIYVPCSPSPQLPQVKISEGKKELPKIFMDDPILLLDYETTIKLLQNIYDSTRGEIKTRPVFKIAEDKQIIGVLTETNQFVMISNPVDPIKDGIPMIKDENYIVADRVFAQSKEEDPKRTEIIKKIKLETQFYGAFRTTVRILLNDPMNSREKLQIMDIIEKRQHENPVDLIETILHTLCDSYVSFQIFDEQLLASLDEISDCFTNTEEKKYCVIQNSKKQLMIPKYHLISKKLNELLYFSRMADELWRYKRIQLFMLNAKMYLNLTNTEYRINPNEMLMLESLLTTDYFKSLEPYEHGNTVITYETANPIITQKYSNEVSQITQQQMIQKDQPTKRIENRWKVECEKSVPHSVTGKKTSSEWITFLPSPPFEEIDLHKTVKCSYYPIIYVYHAIHGTFLTVEEIKTALKRGYENQGFYYDKVLKILNKQGKHEIHEKITKKKTTDLPLEIIAESYFLTTLDLWVLADHYRLPIVLFHQKKLKHLMDDVTWLLLTQTKSAKYYFVRVPTEPDKVGNYLPEYTIIQPAVTAQKMAELEAKSPASTVSLSNYLMKVNP